MKRPETQVLERLLHPPVRFATIVKVGERVWMPEAMGAQDKNGWMPKLVHWAGGVLEWAQARDKTHGYWKLIKVFGPVITKWMRYPSLGEIARIRKAAPRGLIWLEQGPIATPTWEQARRAVDQRKEHEATWVKILAQVGAGERSETRGSRKTGSSASRGGISPSQRRSGSKGR